MWRACAEVGATEAATTIGLCVYCAELGEVGKEGGSKGVLLSN